MDAASTTAEIARDVPASLKLAGDGEVVDDLALVRRLSDGDAAAGEKLVRRYERPLGGYLRRITGSNAGAEDLFQATWLAVLEHLDRFDDKARGANFKAWLFRIATNKAHDRWRKTGRQGRLKEGLRLAGRDLPTPQRDAMVAHERAERLRDAVESLPDAQKQVVLLRYYADMKFADIAELTGCPLSTALGRMHKAARKLRTLLGSEFEDANDE